MTHQHPGNQKVTIKRVGSYWYVTAPPNDKLSFDPQTFDYRILAKAPTFNAAQAFIQLICQLHTRLSLPIETLAKKIKWFPNDQHPTREPYLPELYQSSNDTPKQATNAYVQGLNAKKIPFSHAMPYSFSDKTLLTKISEATDYSTFSLLTESPLANAEMLKLKGLYEQALHAELAKAIVLLDDLMNNLQPGLSQVDKDRWPHPYKAVESFLTKYPSFRIKSRI